MVGQGVGRPAASPGGTTEVVKDVAYRPPTNYKPQDLDVLAANVQLGIMPQSGSGGQPNAQVNAQTGQLGIELFSNTTYRDQTARRRPAPADDFVDEEASGAGTRQFARPESLFCRCQDEGQPIPQAGMLLIPASNRPGIPFRQPSGYAALTD